ncbi:hypothetical protein JCM11641_003264 [Rhodosporidiobolus odoratus]
MESDLKPQAYYLELYDSLRTGAGATHPKFNIESPLTSQHLDSSRRSSPMTFSKLDDEPPLLPPPSLAFQLATPSLPSADLFPSPTSPVTTSDAPVDVQSKRNSKNDLFGLSWKPVLPPPPPPPPASSSGGRSRSSTAESSWSISSSSEGSSSRKSWLEPSPPLSTGLSPPPRLGGLAIDTSLSSPGLDRTPNPKLPSAGAAQDGYGWPLTPPSPAFPSVPTAPPIPFSVPSLPLAPPRPALMSRTSTATPPSPVSAASSRDAALPPTTAGVSNNPLLDTKSAPPLRLSPTPPYLLGEGRHASVYLASFLPRPASEGQVRVERSRRLCAAKRLQPDRESQVAGLGEAFILAKLAAPRTSARSTSSDPSTTSKLDGSEYILGLYGVRDERDGLEEPLPLPLILGGLSRASSVRSRKSLGRSTVAGGTAEGPGSPLRATFGGSQASRDEPPASLASGARQDDIVAGEAGRAASLHLPGNGHRPRLSEPLRPASAAGTHRTGLSVLTSLDSSSSASRRRISLTTPSSPAQCPSSPYSTSAAFSALEPRISLLLEYAPHGHVLSFAKAFPERMDGRLWMRCAREMVAAVEWCHLNGVLHADIKPQNILLASNLSVRLSDFSTSLFLPPASSPPSAFPTDPHGLGTPQYSPPEFVRPLPSSFSFPSDIFSLGVTLGTLLTAREPYEGMRAIERMLHVSRGNWWEWEERRRLKELEREEMEVEEGTVSRAGSVRSVRSGRSSVRGGEGGRGRESSVESVRSYCSTLDGGFGVAQEKVPREMVVKSLMCANWEEEVDEEVRDLLDPALPSRSPSQPTSPAAYTDPDGDMSSLSPLSSHFLSPATTFYPSTSTPLQYFLAFDPFPADSPQYADVVPATIRDLLRSMTIYATEERPTAGQVSEELSRIAVEFEREE